MSLTTDPKNLKLGRGVDDKPISQHEVYLVLSKEEIAKGFVRPVRDSYIHTGKQIDVSEMRNLTEEEKVRYKDYNYIGFISNEDKHSSFSVVGRYITEKDIKSGCGIVTRINQTIAKTYARSPKFYGFTYCVGCSKHLPIEEFTWDGTDQKVGS